MLRAVSLVCAVMLLSGFGVALFPVSKYLDNKAAGKDCASKSDSLDAINQVLFELKNNTSKIEDLYNRISELDKNWEKETNKHARATIKNEIKPLEENLFSMVNDLKGKNLGPLSISIVNSYNYLLIARELIWALRDQESSFDNSPGGGGNDPEDLKRRIDKLERRAEDVANDLDREASDLENKRAKGIFGNKKEVNQKLTGTTEELRRLAQRLRN